MSKIQLSFHKKSHLTKVLLDILDNGLNIITIPEQARLPRNGMKLTIRTEEKDLRLRVFAYKVTTSGRNRPQERRVEITRTYLSGLKPLKGYADIVLGIDTATGKYVGIDNRRLHYGGSTHNASSFFDLEGLSVKPGAILINPRRTSDRLFSKGIEFHCFFDRTRLSEYLLNYREIHSGSYSYGGTLNVKKADRRRSQHIQVPQGMVGGDSVVLLSKAPKRSIAVSAKLIEAAERGDYSSITNRKISPEEFRRLLLLCDEIGALGEQAVLTFERNRLKKLGFGTQAEKVERISLKSIGEGFDILSFEDNGTTPRYIEVKSTVGRSSLIEMSRTEWRTAQHYRDHYYIVRVVNARLTPTLYFVRNPFELVQNGLVKTLETGRKLDLRDVMTKPTT